MIDLLRLSIHRFGMVAEVAIVRKEITMKTRMKSKSKSKLDAKAKRRRWLQAQAENRRSEIVAAAAERLRRGSSRSSPGAVRADLVNGLGRMTAALSGVRSSARLASATGGNPKNLAGLAGAFAGRMAGGSGAGLGLARRPADSSTSGMIRTLFPGVR